MSMRLPEPQKPVPPEDQLRKLSTDRLAQTKVSIRETKAKKRPRSLIESQTALTAALLTLCTTVGSIRAVADVHRNRPDLSPCPFSCREAGIPEEQCRQWEERGICYVQERDLDISADAGRTRVISVNSVLLAGTSRSFAVPEQPITGVAITVRLKDNRKSEAALLTVGLEDGELFEGGTVVESGNAIAVEYDVNHTLHWNAPAVVPNGRKLEVTVRSEDVFIDSISLYQLVP